jgi:hypothetical protein
MSKSLILVKYSIEDKQLCEEKAQNVDSIDVSDEIINELELINITRKISVLEELGGDSYETEVIDNLTLPKIIKKCEDISMIYCSELQKGIENDKKRNIAFDKLTVLLNIRRILRKKQIKYKDDDSIYVIWG